MWHLSAALEKHAAEEGDLCIAYWWQVAGAGSHQSGSGPGRPRKQSKEAQTQAATYARVLQDLQQSAPV